MSNDDTYKAFASRPHLVIVGAGATIDSIPNGDKNGQRSAVMKGFIDKLGFTGILADSGIQFDSDNLEDIYSTLAERNDCTYVRKSLETEIFNYFSSLEIPDTITKYDLLILSLTRKDCIATFNWDGLLVDAYRRMLKITDNLPQMLFLHGNVKVGYCTKCGNYGYHTYCCPRCHTPFAQSKLLFPIRHKNYNNNTFIKTQWDIFEDFLSNAAIVTIYGYSAPKTDVEAIEKLKSAFIRITQDRYFDQIQIIERPGFNHNDISSAWEDLSTYVHGHLEIKESFFDTYLAEFPRRSVEGYTKRTIADWWGSSNKTFEKEKGTNYTLKELAMHISPLLTSDPFDSLSLKTL